MLDWLGRRLRWMRYLLVWPAVRAYRRRARRSLRWRLAGYNLLTLIAGLATAMILVGALAAAAAGARDCRAVPFRWAWAWRCCWPRCSWR